MNFVVEGTIKNDTLTRKFVRQVDAANETLAGKRAITLLGSEQGVPASRVKVAKVEKA